MGNRRPATPLEVVKDSRKVTGFRAGSDYTFHTVNSTSYLLVALTSEGLKLGLIPSVCPICGVKVWELVVHHWGNGRKITEVRRGNYRRICNGCNVSLGSIFHEEYPCWDEQLAKMKFVRMEPFWEEAPHSKITTGEIRFWEEYFGEKLPYLADLV